jgi:hypothetical protein
MNRRKRVSDPDNTLYALALMALSYLLFRAFRSR